MRVISGKARRMTLECPSGNDVRPLADRAREALFSILFDFAKGATVLDLFAGAGTVGIEALSRGAEWCVFVERSPKVRSLLEKNLAHTRLAKFCDVLQRDAFRCTEALTRLDRRFDLIYVGPPFPLWSDPASRMALIALPDKLRKAGLTKDNALAIMQHQPEVHLPEDLGPWHRNDLREYSRNVFSFYSVPRD